MRQTYWYFGSLTLLIYLATPGGYLVDISTTYMLKNQLHASPVEVSLFRVLTAIPLYLTFLFGFARDLWNPFGLRDRGYFLIFAPITAAAFFWMALSHLTYVNMFIGIFSAMIAFRFVSAAYPALLALVGQEQLMSGRLSALSQIVSSIPVLGAAFASGWVTEHLKPSQTFLIVASLGLLLGLIGLWKPRSVFSHAYDQPQAQGSSFSGNFKRLVRHKAIYAPVLLMLLFQFSPGSNTPLQYYLTDHLHASDAIYSDYTAIFQGAFVPVFLLYGWLCKRVALGKLLFWGTILTIPQFIPLLFIHSATWALILAVPIGMMGGIFAGAVLDLAIRSCPPGMQGTMMTLFESANLLSTRGGDLVGSKIFASSPTYGFLYCVIAITLVYALMLPVLLLIPKEILGTKDGEARAEVNHDEILRPQALSQRGS